MLTHAGDPVEEPLYRDHACDGGTCMRQGVAAEIEADLLRCMQALLAHLTQHPDDIKLLSTKYHAPYARLCAEVAAGKAVETVLTMGACEGDCVVCRGLCVDRVDRIDCLRRPRLCFQKAKRTLPIEQPCLQSSQSASDGKAQS